MKCKHILVLNLGHNRLTQIPGAVSGVLSYLLTTLIRELSFIVVCEVY